MEKYLALQIKGKYISLPLNMILLLTHHHNIDLNNGKVIKTNN